MIYQFDKERFAYIVHLVSKEWDNIEIDCQLLPDKSYFSTYLYHRN